MHNYATWVSETNPATLHATYSAALKRAGFGILAVVDHHFNPQGYTALYLLSESHLALHTFPERGQTYVELSSCIAGPFNEFLKALPHE